MSEPIDFRPQKIRLKLPAISWVPLPAGDALAVLFIFIRFFCRIEPQQDRIAVLIRKTGDGTLWTDLEKTGFA